MALSTFAFAAAAAFALQPLGTFHGDEAIARHGERWLALQVGPGRAALVDARVGVKRVRDEILDAPGATTAAEVTVPVTSPAMLLRGPGLRAGPVVSAWTGGSPQPLSTAATTMRLGVRDYRLALECPAGPACRLVLASGTSRQVLLQLPAGRYDDGSPMLGDDGSPKLLFAGDIDRDGRLDLLLDTTDHYNVARPALFLSSPAGSAELVRQVAAHRSTGC